MLNSFNRSGKTLSDLQQNINFKPAISLTKRAVPCGQAVAFRVQLICYGVLKEMIVRRNTGWMVSMLWLSLSCHLKPEAPARSSLFMQA